MATNDELRAAVAAAHNELESRRLIADGIAARYHRGMATADEYTWYVEQRLKPAEAAYKAAMAAAIDAATRGDGEA